MSIPWVRLYQSFYATEIYTCSLLSGESSDAINIPNHTDNAVQITGTFGAAVTVQGALHPTTPIYATMKDANGNDLSFTADSPPTQILPGPYALKVVAGAVTGIVATLKLNGKGRVG